MSRDPHWYPEEELWDACAEAEEAQARLLTEEAVKEAARSLPMPIPALLLEAAVEDVLEAGVDIWVEGFDESDFAVMHDFTLQPSQALRDRLSVHQRPRVLVAVRPRSFRHPTRHRGGPVRRPRRTQTRRARAPARSDDPDPHRARLSRPSLVYAGGRA